MPSNSDSITAPWVGLMPRSLQSATRCACGIDIGTQQKNAPSASMAKTRFGGQPNTFGFAAPFAAGAGATTSGGRDNTKIAIGISTSISATANQNIVCRQPIAPIA